MGGGFEGQSEGEYLDKLGRERGREGGRRVMMKGEVRREG